MKFETIFAIAAMALGTTEAVRLTSKDIFTGPAIPICNGSGSACVTAEAVCEPNKNAHGYTQSFEWTKSWS